MKNIDSNPLGIKDDDYIYINILLDNEWKIYPERHLKYIFNNHIGKELSEVRDMYNNIMGKNVIKSLITDNNRIVIQNNNIKYIKEFDTPGIDKTEFRDCNLQQNNIQNPHHNVSNILKLETENEDEIRESIRQKLIDCIYDNIRWERDKVSRLLSWKNWILYKSNLLK